MTCRICRKSVMKDCLELTRIVYKLDPVTRQTKLKIITLPETYVNIKSKSHKLLERRSYHNQQQYYGVMSEDEIIVVAKCGHIFHKSCLRAFIISYKRPVKLKGTAVDCPVCKEKILFAHTIVLDIKIHNGLTKKTEKQMKNAQWMHKELFEQVEEYQKQAKQVQFGIEQLKAEIRNIDDKLMFTTREIPCMEILEKEYYEMIENINKKKLIYCSSLEENRNLIRIYLNQVTQNNDFPKDSLYEKIPAILLPHLEIVAKDENLLEKFSALVFPNDNSTLPNNKRNIQERAEALLREISKNIPSEQFQTSSMSVCVVPSLQSTSQIQAPLIEKPATTISESLKILERSITPELKFVMRPRHRQIPQVIDNSVDLGNVRQSMQALLRKISDVKNSESIIQNPPTRNSLGHVDSEKAEISELELKFEKVENSNEDLFNEMHTSGETFIPPIPKPRTCQSHLTSNLRESQQQAYHETELPSVHRQNESNCDQEQQEIVTRPSMENAQEGVATTSKPELPEFLPVPKPRPRLHLHLNPSHSGEPGASLIGSTENQLPPPIQNSTSLRNSRHNFTQQPRRNANQDRHLESLGFSITYENINETNIRPYKPAYAFNSNLLARPRLLQRVTNSIDTVDTTTNSNITQSKANNNNNNNNQELDRFQSMYYYPSVSSQQVIKGSKNIIYNNCNEGRYLSMVEWRRKKLSARRNLP